VRSARVEPGDTVVLIGAGYMGLLLVQLLPKNLMKHFIVVDVERERLALARSHGATVTLDPSEVDAVAEVRRLTTAAARVEVRPAERSAVARLLETAESSVAELSVGDVARLRAALGAREGRYHAALTPYEVLLAERVAARMRSGADIVIEAAGARGTLDMATQMVRPGGRLSIFAFHTLREEVDTPAWHMGGYEVQNPAPSFSRDFARDFRDAVGFLGSGALCQDELITHRFAHTRIAEALQTAAAKPAGFIKAAITFD
jgi:threonine dehydrogenase-like Zn-dependent dehydrogenase